MASTIIAGLREESPEVFYAPADFVTVDDADINWLIERAQQVPRRRARICFHTNPGASLHEMLIVHHCSAYVRPHRHLHRQETLTVLKGLATAFAFDEGGQVVHVLPIGAAGTGRKLLHRMPQGQYHNLTIESDWLVFLETTTGPFDPSENEFAPWSPVGTEYQEVERFLKSLKGHLPG